MWKLKKATHDRSKSENRTFCFAYFMLKCNTLNTWKDHKIEELEHGFTTGPVYSPQILSLPFCLPKLLHQIKCLLQILKTSLTQWALKNKQHPFKCTHFPFAIYFFFILWEIMTGCQSLLPIWGFTKSFLESWELYVRAQLVVTEKVKRCFRSQSAVQPSSASTKCCLCWGYFQSSCADVLLRRRVFPPGTLSHCCCPSITWSHFSDCT